ncbi:ABC transporter substrate-binding protein [Streptomyces sp. ODS28]|uniref:ABC transporter substrate-binding protein n=1 Tax=Streptomyces sp. ODS28 TaxID=3136688 RepID=UPI0031EA4DE0
MTSPTPAPSRRRLLSAGGALGFGALLTACGGSGSAQSSGGSWEFTDDRGRTARSEGRPERIVAYISSAAALYDYGITCDGIFGPSKQVKGRPGAQSGDLDTSGITSLGTAFGEFDIERYAKLRPQLLVSNMIPPPKLWYVPDGGAKRISALAPSVGIKAAYTSLRTPLRRYDELARALGADMRAKKVTEAKERFAKAERTLREAARKAGGLRVMAMSGDFDNMYVANPGPSADLSYFKSLGVHFIEGKTGKEGPFWEYVSWENADKYEADLLMLDNREGAFTREQFAEKPVWKNLRAVQEDQVIPWATEERYSYRGYAPVVERLAAALTKSRKLHRG